MLNIYSRAMRYGYSNTRAKAMESKLIDSATMKSIADAKDINSVLSILFQTDYNNAITKFGGLEISDAMFDFAVSENLAERVNRLAEITPKGDQHIIREMIARWDLGNVKRVLEAVDRKQPYDAISRYIISSNEFPAAVLQDAMKEEGIAGTLARLARNRHYKQILEGALAAYRKTGNVLEAMAVIDIKHYEALGDLALELSKRHDAAAELLKMDIDMRNTITLLRAKRKGLKFSDVSGTLIKNGHMDNRVLLKNYNISNSVATFALRSMVFDLKEASEMYDQTGELLLFEISMRNQIFNTSRKMLRLSVLSLGTLVDYIYLKEIEVFTLRALIKSKEYGLTKEEISRLVVWNL